MIAIVNVDPDLRPTGPHRYEIRANRKVVGAFVHNREDDLTTLLSLAAHAVSGSPSPYRGARTKQSAADDPGAYKP